MARTRASRGLINLATGAILLLSIPLLGVLIAWPLWYIGTNHPALYSGLVGIVIAGFVVRGVHRTR